MMWIVYGVLIVILGVVGYYVGKTYSSIGTMVGTGVGVAAGAVISWALGSWKGEDGKPMISTGGTF